MPNYSKVGESLRLLENKGQEQYDDFVRTRINLSTVPLTDTISKNKFTLPKMLTSWHLMILKH